MKLRIATALLLLLLGCLHAVSAENREGTLGSRGEVYLTQVGTFSELFPQAEAPSGDRNVLAMEILRPGLEPEWLVVPESEGVTQEAARFVLFEDVSESVFIVWEGRIGSHPVVKLASYQDGAWSEVLLVSENVWSVKGFPQLAITRDSFRFEDHPGLREVQRTLLHVVWWEETADGDLVLYRPLILQDGRLQGLGPIYALNELAGEPLAEGTEPPTSGLLRHPALQVGKDGRSMTLTFADAATGKLLVLDIGLLPTGLGLLGDDVAELVEGMTPDALGNSGPEAVAGTIRAHIAIGGSRYRLNPRALQQLADEIHEWILEQLPPAGPVGEGELQSMAGPIRAHIAIGGARISQETLDRFNLDDSTRVLRLSPEVDPGAGDVPTVPHLLRITTNAQLPIPAMDEGETHVFSSADSQRVVVAWEVEDELRYREAVDGTWSDVRTLEIGGELALSRALEILHQRALASP